MRSGIVDQIAADPTDGDVVRGSGGYRVMVAYLGAAVPVYRLSILAKGQQANFTPAQIATMYDLT